MNSSDKGRVRDIVSRSIAHNSGAWVNCRDDDGGSVVCEVPSWPRAEEARKALETAGYVVERIENDRTIHVTLHTNDGEASPDMHASQGDA